MAEGPGRKISISSPTTVYTALAILGTVFVLFGTVYLAWRNHELFGSWLPLGPGS